MNACIWRENMSVRRFGALVYGLTPNDTALARELTDGASRWTQEHELLATIAELIDMSNRYFLDANTKKGTTLPRPIKITRPGKTEKRGGTTMDELASMFPQMQERKLK